MSWIERLGIGGIGEDWLSLLLLAAGMGSLLFFLCMWSIQRAGAKIKRKMAKKYEEYCRLYEAGQRESDDAGFRKYVRERKECEEFIQRSRRKS